MAIARKSPKSAGQAQSMTAAYVHTPSVRRPSAPQFPRMFCGLRDQEWHLDRSLGVGVERRGGLIQEEYGGAPHKCARDAQPLPLAPGQTVASFTTVLNLESITI